MFYTIMNNIGGSPSGKTFTQYLTQIKKGVLSLTTTVLILSVVVLLYQAMNAKARGDAVGYQDRITKIGLVVLIGVIIAVTGRLI